MSQYPPGYPQGYDPNNPPPFIPYASAPPKPRPTSVTVLAIIGIILAALGLLGNACGVFAPFIPKGVNPVMDAMYGNKRVVAWTVGSAGVKMVLSLFLLVCSIASLNLSRWARGGMILYSLIAIIVDIVGALVGFLVINPIMQRQLAAMATIRQPAWSAMAGQIGGVCGAVFMLIFPVCVLVFFSRTEVKEAFNRGM